MGSQPEDEEERVKLLEVIAESDETLSEFWDSDDPVAIRQVLDALWDKASALADLERHEDALAVWDELLSRAVATDRQRVRTLGQKAWTLVCLHRDDVIVEVVDELVGLFDHLGCPPGDVPTVARALIWKVDALDRLGRVEDQIRADDDVHDRLGSSPAESEWVAWALCDKARRLLEAEDRLEEALAVSETLRQRLEREPDETLAPVAETVTAHFSELAQTSSSLAGAVGLSLTNVTIGLIHTARVGLSRLHPWIGATLLPADRVAGMVAAVGPVHRRRERQLQVLAVTRTLIERVGASPDPVLRQLSATAQIHQASALFALGRIREGSRAFDPVFAGEESGAADALQLLADREPPDPSNPVTQTVRISLLGARADALAKGDRAIARIAFDDAIQTLPQEARHSRAARLAAWLFRSQAESALIVPDHIPDADPPTS